MWLPGLPLDFRRKSSQLTFSLLWNYVASQFELLGTAVHLFQDIVFGVPDNTVFYISDYFQFFACSCYAIQLTDCFKARNLALCKAMPLNIGVTILSFINNSSVIGLNNSSGIKNK